MANPLLMAEIFDNINEGIYILNRKGDYIYCNNAFLKMVGATREEALSLNAFQLIPEGQVSVSVAVTAFTEKKKVASGAISSRRSRSGGSSSGMTLRR